MDIFFRTNKSLIKMSDAIDIEGRKDKNYLTTSSIDGEKKRIVAMYKNEARALEILDRIDEILEKAIKDNTETISVNIPSDIV